MAEYLPGAITGYAQARAKDSKYQASGSTTHCNEFLCDLVEDIIGGPCEALRKADLSAPALANVQCEQLKAAAKWQAMSFSSDPKGVFEAAQKAANNGHLVVVTYKNPDAGGHGHVALVVPAPAPMFVSGKWGMAVPKIAQAGPSITVTGATPQSVQLSVDKAIPGLCPLRQPRETPRVSRVAVGRIRRPITFSTVCYAALDLSRGFGPARKPNAELYTYVG